ncbi:MAG TPA: hypothetical protein VHA78_04710 [Candidatus Peribacteraceae bacterium]|nr:hypothetical protein [Candidatus Peribacteraceae bacterium]
MDLLIAIISVSVITIIAESVLWSIFRRKAAPLSFPSEFDTSYFRFFEITRIRLIMFAHTILLLTVLILIYVFLW